MEIINNISSKYGNFTIKSSPDRHIESIFIDYQTKLLIVQETLFADKHLNSKETYVTTIDTKIGKIINLVDRKDYIDYQDKIEKNELLRVYSISKRIINIRTCDEYFSEILYNLDTNNIIGNRQRIAFYDKAQSSYIDLHIKHLESKSEEELFWKNEYPKKSFNQKVEFWNGILHRQMRWQGESGYDEYLIFNKDWYVKTIHQDPEFERVFDNLLENSFKQYGWNVDEIRKRINE